MSPKTPHPRQSGLEERDAIVELQQAAYEPLIEVAEGTPLPLLADYQSLLADAETWVVGPEGGPLEAALILQHGRGATLVWSVAVRPGGQSRGLGRRLLALAEERGRAAGSDAMRLYTSVKFERNRRIYRDFGYQEIGHERVGEQEPPWIIVHMEKPL